MTELDDSVRRLESASEAERIYAAEDIGYANCGKGVESLLNRLPEEASLAVRQAIFNALECIEDDAVTEGAIGLLASEDPFVRNQAVELLRRRGARTIAFLQQAFPSAGRGQRKMMLDVLAAVDGPDSTAIYNLALTDTDVNVVITAVESLGNARQTGFRARIEELAGTGDPMLTSACLEALVQIGDARSLEAIRARGAVADFLLPSYLKILGAHGGADAIAEAAGMMISCGAHIHPYILDALTRLRQRHPSAPLPESFLQPLQHIVQSGTPQLRHQAIRLLRACVQENRGA